MLGTAVYSDIKIKKLLINYNNDFINELLFKDLPEIAG